MRLWMFEGHELSITLWISTVQLAFQVAKLVQQLPFCFNDRGGGAAARDLRAVETVASLFRFCTHCAQILRYGCQRVLRGAKADQLRMKPIPSGATTQNGLRQQRFSPHCHETARIQVFRV